MTISRRDMVKRTMQLVGATGLFFACDVAYAEGFLEGTWIVRCRNGHDDQVDGITRNHDCEECPEKSVDGGNANVVCPDGHATHVGGVTRDHLCTHQLSNGGICGKQCRR
jgi:hypothetical protein